MTETCCRRCRGALQICRWDLCDCHRRSAEKNLSHDTRTYRNPTADTALRNLTNPKRRNKP